MFDLLVRGGSVVEGESLQPRTLAVRDGKIAALLDPGADASAKQTIDARGCLVLPGLVDAHVHFREPGLTHKEDFESGSRAAALGGVTTVMVMPTDAPMTQTPEQFIHKRGLAEGRCHVDFALQALLGPELRHVGPLAKLGAISFEIFLGLLGEGQKIADDETLRAALRAVREAQGIAGVSTFEKSESTGVARALAAHPPGGRMHLRQISDAQTVHLLPSPGAGVSSEVTPHNLLLTEETFQRLGAVAKVLPPLRSGADTAAMRQALASGRISIVATDHAPHAPQEKDLPVEKAPGGFPGVQTMLSLLLKLVADGALTYADLVRVACTQPARLFGLFPQKGALHPGADADIVIVDPARPTQIRNAEQASKAARTPFDGYAVPASVVRTLLRGETIALEGRVSGAARGRFLAPVVYTSRVNKGETP